METSTYLSAIGFNGPGWFFAALMFNFVAGLNLLVQEKEMKLRDIMKIMGLYVILVTIQ